MSEVTMYKLLSQDMKSHGGMRWEIGKTNKATGIGVELCTDQLLHCYSDPWLAVILNPIHANIVNPRLFRISCSEIVATDGLKHGCKEQTLGSEIPLPTLSRGVVTAFGIKCALMVCKDAAFGEWARRWISNEDRSRAAAAACAAACADRASADPRASAYADRSAAYAAHAARAAAYATTYAAVCAAKAATYADAYADAYPPTIFSANAAIQAAAASDTVIQDALEWLKTSFVD